MRMQTIPWTGVFLHPNGLPVAIRPNLPETTAQTPDTFPDAVVEFVGSNWRNVQREEHSYSAAATWEYETLDTTLLDTSKTFLHVQTRSISGALDEQSGEVYLASTTQIGFYLESGASLNPTNVVWVIENTQSDTDAMSVARYSGTRSGGVEPYYEDLTITAVDSLDTASIWGESARSTGTGTAVPRGNLGLELTATNTVQLFASDNGQTQSYRYEIVQWPGSFIAGATWAENEDTKRNDIPKGILQRLRFQVHNAGAAGSTGETYQLQVAETGTCGSGSYSAVPTDSSGDWQIVDSTKFNDADPTNNVPGGLTDAGTTFVPGELKDAGNTTGSITFGIDDFSEIEFAIQATNNATNGGDYCFRLYDTTGATPLDSYTYYAEASIVAGAYLDQTHYRWRNDDGTEAGATWTEAEDTKQYNIAKGTLQRLRFQVHNSGVAGSLGETYQLQVAETGICGSGSYSAVPTGTSGDWQIVDSSYITDGDPTTNVAGGLTDAGSAFIPGEIKDAGNTTGSITLGVDDFTEIEFAIQATDNASDGGDYCFRLYDTTGGAPLGGYTSYAEAGLACMYGYNKQLTVDASRVGGSSGSLTNYPVLVSIQNDGDLKTTANGGHVQHSSGYDIIFRRGSTTLDHEIEYYDGVNGTLVAWVRIPSLSKSVDTVFYIYYGNGCISAPTENAAGVWSSYEAVYHLHQGVTDSTGNGHNGSDSGTADIGGQIANARDFEAGDPDYIGIANSSQINLMTVTLRSYSLWFKAESMPALDSKYVLYEEGGGTHRFNIYLDDDAGTTTLQCGQWASSVGAWLNTGFPTPPAGITWPFCLTVPAPRS